VILLDVMLPEMDGFEVLRGIREHSSVPVLMLTARGDEVDRVKGLETGADDYLPKTFSTRELLARLRAVLRRACPEDDSTGVFVNGPLSLKTTNRECTLHGQSLELTALEFDLLLSLITNLDRVRTREQLLNDVAERDYDVFDRSVDVHISALRQKLGDNPKQPAFIRTIRSVGYLMIRH
jgi:two-component system response regulator CpxR